MSENKTIKLHTISIQVQNQPGVLSRVALVFARRGFNIESLVVSSSFKNRKFSTMTITAEGNEKELEQIIKQLKKLINVLSATDYIQAKEENKIIEKELALIKVRFQGNQLTSILQIVEHFKSETIDMHEDSLIIQITGSTEKINACIDMMKQYQLVEVLRSGKILIKRGESET